MAARSRTPQVVEGFDPHGCRSRLPEVRTAFFARDRLADPLFSEETVRRPNQYMHSALAAAAAGNYGYRDLGCQASALDVMYGSQDLFLYPSDLIS